MTSLKTLFDLLSGIQLSTLIRQKLLLPRYVLFISGYIGFVISVIVLLNRSLRTEVLFFFQFACCVSHTYCFAIWSERCSPHPQHSSALIYSFRCVCSLHYIGRTNQRLNAWIKQHVPTKKRLGNYFSDHINNTYRSSIAEYLINNRDCASSYLADQFTILSRFHSDFHLKVFETIHILTHKQSLCKQREYL